MTAFFAPFRFGGGRFEMHGEPLTEGGMVWVYDMSREGSGLETCVAVETFDAPTKRKLARKAWQIRQRLEQEVGS